jgi:hypothetical protein
MFENLGRVMKASDTLKVECGGCMRRRTFARPEAIKAFGEGAAPYDIRRKVRCTECGRSGFAMIWI